MKEEFKHLMDLLSQHQQGKKVDLNELLRTSTAFFDDLKGSFLDADNEEKKEVLAMVNKMYAALSAQAQEITKSTGMKDEEIAAYVQNPNNFSPEQWKLMQDARDKIQQSSKDISQFIQDAAGQDPSAAKKMASDKPKQRKALNPKRDKWMKS